MKNILKLFVFSLALFIFSTLSVSAATTLAPYIIGTYDTPSNAQKVVVNGNYAYVADAYSGLQIIDISNPSMPKFAGSYDTPGIAMDVFVYGKYVYISDKGIFLDGELMAPAQTLVVDVSNQTSPALAASFPVEVFTIGAISGSYAYSGGLVDNKPAIKIYNLSNPISPTLVSETKLKIGGLHRVAASGNYVYFIDNVAYFGIIDVSNPNSPTLMSNIEIGAPQGLSVSENYAYIANSDQGLNIYDVSTKLVFHEGKINDEKGRAQDTGNAYGTFVSGNHAYVAGTSLKVFDITDKSKPILLGQYKKGSFNVTASGDYVYLPAGTSGVIILQFKPETDIIKDLNKDIKVDTKLTEKLKGKILLQMESKGEAWYVNPKDGRKYALGKPSDATAVIKKLGTGISNANLAKIPRNGTNDKGSQALMNKLKGKIVIQVQSKGEAWYIHPVTGKRYFLGKPADALAVIKKLGIGVSNNNLNKVRTGLVVK